MVLSKTFLISSQLEVIRQDMPRLRGYAERTSSPSNISMSLWVTNKKWFNVTIKENLPKIPVIDLLVAFRFACEFLFATVPHKSQQECDFKTGLWKEKARCKSIASYPNNLGDHGLAY